MADTQGEPQRWGLIGKRYLLREQIGRGGMGRVWLAWDEMLDREVAIKEVVPPDWLSPKEREDLRTLTLREARAAGRINHPHVVKIYDVLRSEEWPWIVMEYVASSSLQQVLNEQGAMPPGKVATIGLALLGALRAAHEAGVLHRDIKPHNVLIGDDGRVVLTDFGLATLDSDGAITHAGRFGTPQYVAPERAKIGLSSAQADLWSLGATLYAAVEGRSPYARPTMMETLTALATDPPDPMRRAGPLKPVISGLLRRDPSERMGLTEAEVLLTEVAAGAIVADVSSPDPVVPKRAPRQVARTMRRRRNAGTALLAVAAVAAAALGVVMLTDVLRDRGSVAQAQPEPSASAASPAVPLEQLVKYGVLGCEVAPAKSYPLPSVDGKDAGPYALPDKWSWYHDANGFWVSVPAEWTYWRIGSVVCFRDPLGLRVMGVDPSLPVDKDAIRSGQAQRSLLQDAGALQGYDEVLFRSVVLATPAAEWEFKYRWGQRDRHSAALVVSGAKRNCVLVWITDEFDFQPSYSFYGLVKASFRQS